MIQILRLGENATHASSFKVDRPQGYPVYLILLVKTPANFYIDNEWCSTPGDVAVIFKPGQKHLYSAAGSIQDSFMKKDPLYPAENMDGVNHAAYIDDWAHIESSTPILPEHFPYGQPIVLHNPSMYYDLFHLINNEFFGISPHKKTIIDNLTNALIHKISDESNTNKFPSIYYDLVSLRENIYSFPTFEWSTEYMANSLHISTGYFHSLYKKYFNTTCIADVIHSRIQSACELLTSTDKPVDEIGILCGYNNTEHFIRQFKREQNITPSHYRKNMIYPKSMV